MILVEYEFPIETDDLKTIQNMISSAGWLSTTFRDLGVKQFCLETYFPNDKAEFSVLLDRNFISELMRIFDNTIVSPDYILNDAQRTVAAHQVFFQLANILSEPSISCYEYADGNAYDEVNSELSRFRIADNLPVAFWCDLALGRCPVIQEESLKRSVDGITLSRKESKKPLKNFEANFIIIKKTILLLQQGLPNDEVILNLLDWLYQEYLFTAPSVLFLNYFLAPNTPGLKKMVKSYDIVGMRNATWDLTFIQEYLKKIKAHNVAGNRKVWLACSRDKAINAIIPLMFAVGEESVEEGRKKIKSIFDDIWRPKTGKGERIYKKMFEYLADADSMERKCKQRDFGRHVENIKKELDAQLARVN